MRKYALKKDFGMNKENLLILGAGQYGQVVRETAEAMGIFDQMHFLDDNNPTAVGKLAEYVRFRDGYACAFVAMGNPALRKQWLKELEEAGFELPVLVHPKAYVSPTAILGGGTIVEPMAVINTGAVVEKGGLLCAGCIVNHNAHIASCCQIDCGAVVAAGASVPESTKVPSGTVYQRK